MGDTPTLDRRFLVNLQGREYCTYQGVLDLAHQKGLKAIDTTLVQIPTEENGHVAIVKACVILKDGETFVDYGDASPRNVNSKIATALIRMASTRAKGRALRDSANVGVTMLEELPSDEEEKPRYPPDKWGAKKPEVVGTPKERADAALYETVARTRERMAALPQTGSGMTPIGATKGPVVCNVCKVPFTIEQIAHCDRLGIEYTHPRCLKVGEEQHA